MTRNTLTMTAFRQVVDRIGWPMDAAIIAGRGACRTCIDAAGVYRVDSAPNLPMAGCTKGGGCRCLLAAVPRSTHDPRPGTHETPTLPPMMGRTSDHHERRESDRRDPTGR